MRDTLKMIRYAAIAWREYPRMAGQPNGQSRKLHAELICWGLAATLIVAASSYAIGRRSFSATGASSETTLTATVGSVVKLPEALAMESTISGDGQTIATPFVADIVLERRPDHQGSNRGALRAADGGGASETTFEADDGARNVRSISSAQTIEGASGRLIRIGRYLSEEEAAKGLEEAVRHYPGMHKLQSLAVAIKSLRDGHTYYRLQVATGSEAQSEVLCERVRELHQNCTIIGSNEPSGETAL